MGTARREGNTLALPFDYLVAEKIIEVFRSVMQLEPVRRMKLIHGQRGKLLPLQSDRILLEPKNLLRSCLLDLGGRQPLVDGVSLMSKGSLRLR